MCKRRTWRLALAAAIVPTLSYAAGFGDPLPDLTPEQQTAFQDGKTAFVTVEAAAEGLGPIFNENSCAACHVGPAGAAATGAVGGTTERLETRLGKSVYGAFDPHSTLVALSAFEGIFYPATSGQPSHLINADNGEPAIGRFGWKAQVPTLHVFSGDAYLNEMGVTNPSFMAESCPQGDCSTADGHPLSCNPFPGLNDEGDDVDHFTDFMQLLAPPPRGPVGPTEIVGETVFNAIGCAQCHTKILTTGSSPIAALDHVDFQPFSDFLLHDMGSLGDGITQNEATGRLMRTQPLWGLRAQTSFLHDGRALTISDAIKAHAGQGSMAGEAFEALDPISRAALLDFLNSL